MAIHFKFRSAVEYDSIDIDGPFISIGSLKEKIVEHKNLGRATDFDLLITNAQTAEEYSDESFLLPKNTSVIIKRVPASRSKPVLRVEEQPKIHGSVADSMVGDYGRGTESTSQATALSNVGMDSLDDFGVDLYAIPEPVVSKADLDENTRIAAMVNTTATEWQRQTHEGLGGGRGSGRGGYGRGSAARGGGGRAFGRATPPQGYVCHRCGQPGHFIQHCPTNGDPTYDMRKMKPPVGIPKTRLKADQEGSYILPDGSVAVMQPDESVFAKEADALLAIRPIYSEPPPELKCPLCGTIFKDAVMIPCCQYSFCDKCIRDELIAKGKCPQCESTKFKNDDLLPNINLRQAIDRFLEAQMTTSGASDSFYKQHQLPDVDSGPRKVAAPAGSRLQIELRKPVISTGAPVQAPPSKEVVVEDAVESSKDKKEKTEQVEGSAVLTLGDEDSGGAIEGPPSKEYAAETSGKEEAGVSLKEEERQGFVNDEGEAGMISKNIEPLFVKETDGVAVESEVSKGKKKKKRSRPVQAADGAADNIGGGKVRKGERVCYLCGSPDHFARDCIDHGGPGPGPYGGPHPAMFGPGGMPPMGVPPYGGAYNMEWHGPPMPPHGGPFGYGEGMHGPGPGMMPFDRPMMPGPGYGAPPFGMPPMYPGIPHHGYMRGPGMMGMMDRPPLSREEFLEVQERQRQERHRQHRMMEHSEREWSPEALFPRDRERERDGNVRHQSPELESRRLKETRERRPDHYDHVRKHDVERESGDEFSDDTEYRKTKSGRIERRKAPDRVVVENRHSRKSHLSNDDDVTSLDELKTRRPVRRGDRDEKLPERDMRRERESSRQHREFVDYSSEHDGPVVPERHDREGSRSLKSRRMESSSKRINVSGESRYRSSKREMPEDSGHSDLPPEPQDLRLKLGRKREKERQERRHHVYDDAETEEIIKGEALEKPRLKRHHSRSKSKGEEPVEYDSEDSRRKQKRKHRKHYDDSIEDRPRDIREKDVDEPVASRKLKSKGGSNPSSNSIEGTRWQLVDSAGEIDEGHNSHSYHTKRKSQRSYRS
nr:E3 ubiquitin ligase PARAQUAT TOLERANCE 3-like isoform X3 [Physcomitrium patens]|eukprot:XP_024377086.1 E3 ubiquitin ligase PARAQUAT TOLERANCE 3-like isoform X3 [Physcomitrella patens]